jgi:hypothetical protein
MRTNVLGLCLLALCLTPLFSAAGQQIVTRDNSIETAEAISSTLTRVYVDPSNSTFSAPVVGTLFNVTIKVDNMDDMWAWWVGMSFNDSMINVTRWYEPTWDSKYVFYGKPTQASPEPPTVAYAHVAPDVGWAGVVSQVVPPPSPGGGFTGNGTLCILTFNITAVPPLGQTYSCSLNITNSNTYWVRETERLYDTYANGYFEEFIRTPSKVYMFPSNFTFSPPVVGTLFNVTIKVDNMDDMKAWQVIMDYDDSMINVTRWYEPTWDPKYVFYGHTTLPIPAPPKPSYGPGGWVGVGASLFPAPSPGGGFTGNGTLCIFTFNITAVPLSGKTFPLVIRNQTYQPLWTFWIKSGETTKRPFDVYVDGYCVLAAIHDVAVTNIILSKTVAGQGTSVGINVTVENQGGLPETFNVTAYANTTKIGNQTVSGLESNTKQVLSFNWNTSGFNLGNYTISAVADVVPNETDTSDNTYIDGAVTVRLPIHDVAVAGVTPSKTLVGQGFSMSVNVTVNNPGDFTETLNVTLSVQTTPPSTEVQRILVSNLLSGETRIVTLEWNTSGWPRLNYTIIGYAVPVPGEANTADNKFTDGKVQVTLVGDVNGDGSVDMADISLIIEWFMTNPPTWNPNCDINNDLTIDMADISLAIDNFMQTGV